MVFAYYGSPSGLDVGGTRPSGNPANADWATESDQANCSFGQAIASAGDVNGDGYSDIIIGAFSYDNGQTDEGRALVYHGSSTGLDKQGTRPAGNPTNADWSAECNQGGGHFGRSAVASAGYVNGDGYSEVIVGALNYDYNLNSDSGRVYVYYGSASGLSAGASWTAANSDPYTYVGRSVACAGDVNGDGYADVIMGAHGWDLTGINDDRGRVYVFHGSASGLSGSADWYKNGANQADNLGAKVASLGDVNGDGYADVAVGAIYHDNTESNEGKVYLYYGNGGPGQSLRPQQRRATDAGPVAHLAGADAPDRFRLALLGRTPFGRNRVTLEREVKHFGSPFNGLETAVGVHWYDTGVGGAELNELTEGLLDEAPYHWRVRMRYHPASSPFAQRSRWLTVPWNGWQETDLRTGDPAAAGRVPDQVSWAGQPLSVDKTGTYKITLTWDVSCLLTDTDFAIYEGTIGEYYSHESRYCSTGNLTTKTFTPLAGSTYYLVVPLNPTREGSYGTDYILGTSAERPQGELPCQIQQIGSCY